MFTVYLVLCLSFVVLSAISMVLGEIFGFLDHVFDAIGNVFEGLLGGADAGGLDAPQDGGVQAQSNPLSVRTVFAFLAGFGAGGIMGKGLGMSDPLSLLPAFTVGFIVGAIVWLMVRFIYAQQGTTSIQETDFINQVGRLSISIPGGEGMGQLVLNVKGETKIVPAISASGEAIPVSTRVYIESMEGGKAIVKKMTS